MTETTGPETFAVTVERVQTLTPRMKSFLLRRTDGLPLPGYPAGGHISVRIPTGNGRAHEGWRSYSLIDLEGVDTTAPQDTYLIGVQREEPGTGGSRYMHDELKQGAQLHIRTAPNGFPLETPRDGIVLLAGGIGVTPIITMGAALKRAGKQFELHYTARTAAQFVYQDQIRAIAGTGYFPHTDDDPDTAFFATNFVASLTPGQPIYVCGPEGMINAVFTAAKAAGWPEPALHAELFTEIKPQEGDAPFEVELKSTGDVLTVPADKSLLDVLIEKDLFVMYDCRQGHCGLCSVNVLSGEIDHRDIYLTDGEKSGGKVMQSCVSRGKGRLVLDL